MPAPPVDCQIHSSGINMRLDEIMAELKNIRGAFPSGPDGVADIYGHRNYHEAKIRAAKAEESFWTELRLELAKKGAWALILVLLGLIVAGVAAKLGIGGGR